MSIRAIPWALTLGLLSLAGAWLAQESETEVSPAPQEAFDFDELLARGREGNQAWTPFLERPSMLAGVYRLAAGATDGQKPHDDDELYYVVRGTAGFTADGVEHSAKAGSLFFVAAEVEHRFHDIEEDLEVLVFFAKAPAAPR